MTIASQTSRIAYTGDGATTAFAVPFYFAANSDLVVVLQNALGNETVQTLGTNYALTGATLSAGGTCTFTIAPTTGYVVTVYRDPPITQTTSYNNNDPFPAKSHELALDKLTTIVQRLKDQLSRAVRQTDGDAAADDRIPTLPNRKSKYAAWNSIGTMIASAGAPPNNMPVSSYMGPVLGSANATDFFNFTGQWTQFPTRAAAQAASVSTAINMIAILGYTTLGDAPVAWYTRVASQPTHAGKIQTADLGWWVITGDAIWPEQFGAKGDAGTPIDDLPAFQAAETCRFALSCELRFMAKNYYLNNPNSWIVMRPQWRGMGNNVTVLTMAGSSPICILMNGGASVGVGYTSGYMRDLNLWTPASRTTGQALRLEGDATYQPDEFNSTNLKITGSGSWDIPLYHSGIARTSPPGLRFVVHTNLFLGQPVSAALYANQAVQLTIMGGGTYGGAGNASQIQFAGSGAKPCTDILVTAFKCNSLLNVDFTIGSVFSLVCGSVTLGAGCNKVTVMGTCSGTVTNGGALSNIAALG